MIAVTNERGTQTVDVNFEIWKEENGQPTVWVERIDIRKEKKYGVRLSIRATVEAKTEWSLTGRLCVMTHRHALEIAKGSLGAAGGKASASAYAPTVNMSVFIPAESPKKILDSSHTECRAAIALMVSAIEDGFKAALAEHEATVSATVDAQTATQIAKWVAARIEANAEEAINYKGRMRALEEERDAKIKEFAKAWDLNHTVRSAVNQPDSLEATERAIVTALANVEKFIDAKLGTEGRSFFVTGPGVEIKTEELVEPKGE